MIPRHKKHFRTRCYFINGLTTGHLQVETDILVTGRHQVSTLVVNHRTCDIVCTIICIAKIIVKLCTSAALEQLLIIFYRLHIVTLGILSVGVCLRRSGSLCLSTHHQQCQQQQSQAIATSFLQILHGVLNLHNGSHRRFIGLSHVTRSITWCIALKLTFVESRNKHANGIGINILTAQLVSYIFFRELLDGHVQLITYISPQSTKHLIVELVLLALVH